MINTESKRIVLTGVSRGLGLALAEKLITLGHTVLGCGRTRPMIDKLRRVHGKPHDFAIVDVADDVQVKAWAQRLEAEYGPADLLINNAAMINRNAPLWQVPADEFATVIDVNIKGVVNVIRHFAPAMIARQSGIFVNLSSGWGRSTAPEVAPYCGSKWAIEGLTRALAQELPQGMAAIPLNPGIIDTAMLRSCFGDDAGSYPTPEEWAATAAPFILAFGPKDNGKPLTVPA